MPPSHALRPLLQVSCAAEKPATAAAQKRTKKRPCAPPTARQQHSSALEAARHVRLLEISKKSGANTHTS